MALIERTPSAYAYPLLIGHLLHTPLANRPAQQIVHGERRHDYRTLRERIGRLGGMLRAQGVDSGEVVAVMDWDSHRYLEAYFAVPMLGAVLMTVNVRLSPEQISYTLAHSGARVLLVHRDFLPLLEAILPQLPELRVQVLLEDAPGAPVAGMAGEYEALLAQADPATVFPEFDENSRATTFYTTGTTGLPKAVYFSHRQLVLHTLAAVAAFGSGEGQGRLHQGDVYMPITPMFHVHAWGVPYMATMLGLKQVYPGRYLPDRLLKLIRDEGVTFSHCVPTILHMLLTHPEDSATDLRGLKMVIGGSALPLGLARAARARGIDVFGGYGMSETCPILTLAQVDGDADVDAGTDGRADGRVEQDQDALLELRTRAGRTIPLVDLRIVDEDLHDVARDGVASGEVVVRAPWLTQGYLGNPAASEDLWAGGYLHTGDIGVIDPAGYLRVTDRIKDVIKSGGEWISSLALEDLISRHPAVSEVAVIGIPDPHWGERPLPLVVRKPGTAVSQEELLALLHEASQRGEISRYAVPERVAFVEQIDRTSVGKVDKKLLRARHAPTATAG